MRFWILLRFRQASGERLCAWLGGYQSGPTPQEAVRRLRRKAGPGLRYESLEACDPVRPGRRRSSARARALEGK